MAKTSLASRQAKRPENEWQLRCEWLKRKHLMMCERANRQAKVIRLLEAQLKVFEEVLEAVAKESGDWPRRRMR